MIWPKAATCGHLRPLAWNSLERPLAATRGHSLGTVWSGHLRPVAATRLEMSGAATCGHLRPLAATRLGQRPFAVTSGGKLLPCTCLRGLLHPLAPAAICSQTTSGYKWLQAAVSGCMLHAGGHTRQSWHLEKYWFCWKGCLFQVCRLDR